MQPNAGVGWLLRKTTPAPIYGTRAFAGARTDRLGVASKRKRHPSKPTDQSAISNNRLFGAIADIWRTSPDHCGRTVAIFERG